MSELTLESRIQRLEDIEAIRQLKHRYCAFCDEDYNADKLAPLFTEDAVWDGGPMGRFEGRDAIHAFFSATTEAVPFAIHHVTNPIIEVEGDVATGHWYLWQPMTFAATGQAIWLAARYEDRYRRHNDEWRFEHVQLTLRALTPYEEGWGKTQIMEIPTQ